MRGTLTASVAVTVMLGVVPALAQQSRQVPPKPDKPVPTAPETEELNIPTGEHWLGTIRIPVNVLANGEPLPAGQYRVRLTGQVAEQNVIGQLAILERWVEFLQGGKVRGRAMAPVVPSGATKQVVDSAPPPPGRARVQHLREDDYLRVWFNYKGDQILIYLPIQPRGPAVEKPVR